VNVVNDVSASLDPAVPVQDGKRKKTAQERFGTKLNPFGAKSAYSVTRSDDFRRIAALPRRTEWTDYSEALTLAFALPPRKPGTCPSNCPCRGTGVMKLRPLQAWALSEFLEQRGGIGMLSAGSGKTLVSLLLPILLGWQRPVLFVPASLRDKTVKIDMPLLARHWRLPPLEGPGSLEVCSYEELSQTSFADYLELRKIPDGIISDECHKLAHRSAARTKRILRFFSKFPTTEFIGMSGSIVHRSVMDYGHTFHIALKETSPLPHGFMELKTWADCLDEGIPDFARPDPGALRDFCAVGETPRDGYRRRLLETAGVVASSDLSTNIGLQICELPMPKIPPKVVEAFQRLRNKSELPEGEMATTALDQLRHARELLLGFYLRWVWPKTEDGKPGKPDLEWMKKRRAWRKYVRKMTTRSHFGKWLDTEAQVAKAVINGDVECKENEVSVTGKVIRNNVNVYAEWVEMREARRPLWGGKPEPNKEVVWLSDYMIEALEQWASKNVGIVWVENIGFLEKLRERGNVCFGAGENEIELEDGSRSVFASFAHAVGKNLQMWSRMCFSAPLQSGKAWEQALARQHRPGQLADDVVADVFLGCRETWWAFERSKADAVAIEATLGQPQRLNKATIVVSTTEDLAMSLYDVGNPLWAATGHAKIDGSLGVLREDGTREISATPTLTAMWERVKNEEDEDDDELSESSSNDSSSSELDEDVDDGVE